MNKNNYYFQKVKKRFNNVWTDKYPKFWHLINIAIGFFIGFAFALTYEGTIGLKIGLFFVLWPVGYLLSLAFTYGIVRARNVWKK